MEDEQDTIDAAVEAKMADVERLQQLERPVPTDLQHGIDRLRQVSDDGDGGFFGLTAFFFFFFFFFFAHPGRTVKGCSSGTRPARGCWRQRRPSWRTCAGATCRRCLLAPSGAPHSSRQSTKKKKKSQAKSNLTREGQCWRL
jgi:hypothetical protein